MKKPIVFHHEKVEVPLYFGFLHVVVASDLGAAVALLAIDRDSDPDNMSGFGALTTERQDENGLTHWYALFQPDTTPAIIAHEAKHLVNFVFLSRGIALDLHNDEPECYLLGWMVGQIHSELKRHHKKAKKANKS